MQFSSTSVNISLHIGTGRRQFVVGSIEPSAPVHVTFDGSCMAEPRISATASADGRVVFDAPVGEGCTARLRVTRTAVRAEAARLGEPSVYLSNCTKDADCFDAAFACESCCLLSRTSTGAACWDGTYTFARCCSAWLKPHETASISASIYEPELPCFDKLYPCEECCLSAGARTKGQEACWRDAAHFARCCSADRTCGGKLHTSRSGSLVLVDTALDREGDCEDLVPLCAVWALLGSCNSGT